MELIAVKDLRAGDVIRFGANVYAVKGLTPMPTEAGALVVEFLAAGPTEAGSLCMAAEETVRVLTRCGVGRPDDVAMDVAAWQQHVDAENAGRTLPPPPTLDTAPTEPATPAEDAADDAPSLPPTLAEMAYGVLLSLREEGTLAHDEDLGALTTALWQKMGGDLPLTALLRRFAPVLDTDPEDELYVFADQSILHWINDDAAYEVVRLTPNPENGDAWDYVCGRRTEDQMDADLDIFTEDA